MKYLFFSSLLLCALVVSAASNKVSLMKHQHTWWANSVCNICLPTNSNNSNFKQRILPPELRNTLYNSISIGMSYDEVRAIIGWDGILIYENEIDSPEGQIHEKIYQWNNEDIYLDDDSLPTTDEKNSYWSVTLQFQNNILIGKSSFNLQRR
ncbi:hypothetical protein [Merismopedia glauca]|uniref:Uncharacterized protein n=1 Tax=Merismopedia glauca CCAP 1448/3 TaxID=1296344 RepID=A0A2T1C0B9_9CYAN|nr:hypothetical protein [Merismopedia glauca]PSB01725.1 hypothetical protein C7B64_16720 [Merismopedia glauca CCAP 1448/3]